MKRLGLLILLFAMPLLAQQPATTTIPLPQRDGITIDDLQTQIANCSINATAEAKYEAKLVARIRELEAQVAKLSPKTEVPKLPVDSKAK